MFDCEIENYLKAIAEEWTKVSGHGVSVENVRRSLLSHAIREEGLRILAVRKKARGVDLAGEASE